MAVIKKKKKLKPSTAPSSKPQELQTLSDLKASPKNPRRIGAENLARLKRTLQEYGDLSGIVWNARTGELVAGHQRIRALTEEHGEDNVELRKVYVPEQKLPVRVFLDTPAGAFDVRVVDWEEAKANAAMIAANSMDAQGEYDWQVLSELLAELNAADIDLGVVTGLAEFTFEPLIMASWEPPAISEQVEEPSAEAGSVRHIFSDKKNVISITFSSAQSSTLRKHLDAVIDDLGDESFTDYVFDLLMRSAEDA